MFGLPACEQTTKKPAHSLHPIEVHSPWYRIRIDLIVRLPRSKSGNAYIVTCCDYFTKWPEAAAIPDKSCFLCRRVVVHTYYKTWQPSNCSI